MAIVKANCYEQGDILCQYIEDYVDCFGVSCATEGASLRGLGITKEILVLGYNSSQHDISKSYDLTVGLSSMDDYTDDLSYQIAVDTGMNRLGMKSIDELKTCINTSDGHNIFGIYSHIFDSSSTNIAKQMTVFDEFTSVFKERLSHGFTHISSSSNMDSEHVRTTDMTRLGIGLYTGAVSILSDIMLIKHVLKGETIGYDGDYTANCDMKIAIVSGGYADGIIRSLSGFNVIINGEFCPIIGKISMDSFQCDISGVLAKAGDSVIIMDSENITVSDISKYAKMSMHEIYTGLRGRYKYVYFN